MTRAPNRQGAKIAKASRPKLNACMWVRRLYRVSTKAVNTKPEDGQDC